VHISDDEASKPIPASKQSMAPKRRDTSTKPALHNELFWYREALLQSFVVEWLEENGTRHGELSLRQEKMTLGMLEAFRAETFRVHLSYSLADGKHSGHRRYRWDAKVNELSLLHIQLHNFHGATQQPTHPF
jgi:trafficking protein particle complex subunit 9